MKADEIKEVLVKELPEPMATSVRGIFYCNYRIALDKGLNEKDAIDDALDKYAQILNKSN